MTKRITIRLKANLLNRERRPRLMAAVSGRVIKRKHALPPVSKATGGSCFFPAVQAAVVALLAEGTILQIMTASRAADVRSMNSWSGPIGSRSDAKNSYQPDVMVYCGEPVSGDALVIPNPIIVVEVLSPGNVVKDLRDKLQGYFRVASVQHYLIADPDTRVVIHHARGHADVVATRIVSEGSVLLDPPGLTLALSAVFGEPAP